MSRTMMDEPENEYVGWLKVGAKVRLSVVRGGYSFGGEIQAIVKGISMYGIAVLHRNLPYDMHGHPQRDQIFERLSFYPWPNVEKIEPDQGKHDW